MASHCDLWSYPPAVFRDFGDDHPWSDVQLRLQSFMPPSVQEVLLEDISEYALRGDIAWEEIEPPNLVHLNVADAHSMMQRWCAYVLYFYIMRSAQLATNRDSKRKVERKAILHKCHSAGMSTHGDAAVSRAFIAATVDRWKVEDRHGETRRTDRQFSFAHDLLEKIDLPRSHRHAARTAHAQRFLSGSASGYDVVLFPQAIARKKRLCAQCGIEHPTKMKLCGGCKGFRLCSRFCMRAFWLTHRSTCNRKYIG